MKPEDGGQPDRVSISIGRTVAVNYNSVRVDVGMSSDLQQGETPQQGMSRVEKVCRARLARLAEKMREKLDY